MLKRERIANDDKLLSLWGEHSRVIRRSKQGRPVEFGHKVTIWESQEGMLLCGGIYQQGNPAESPIVAAELDHMKSNGLHVESLTVNRGYWDPKTLAKIEAEGTRVYCPKKGKRSAEPRGPEACPINSASTNYSTN
ncbi:MAG: hypothetical protein EXQ58_09535 [Acidobacteria bacterium]|nr:hypothetical protein [Acidobacteriota bacterium]